MILLELLQLLYYHEALCRCQTSPIAVKAHKCVSVFEDFPLDNCALETNQDVLKSIISHEQELRFAIEY